LKNSVTKFRIKFKPCNNIIFVSGDIHPLGCPPHCPHHRCADSNSSAVKMDPCRCYHCPLLRRQFRVPFLLKKNWFCLYQLLFKMDGLCPGKVGEVLVAPKWNFDTTIITTNHYSTRENSNCYKKYIKKTPKTTSCYRLFINRETFILQKKHKNQTGKRHQKKTSNENEWLPSLKLELKQNLRKLSSPLLLRELRRYPKKISKS
jgi:hypothetical protein